MRFEFEHLGTTTPFELTEGQHLLGGGPEDHIRLEGLPPALLTLRIEARRLLVEAARTFTVNEVLVPPGVPRLVLAGEVLGLSEQMRLRVLAEERPVERGVGTVAVLKDLLTGTETLASRAATLTCLTGLDVGRTFALADTCTEIGRGSEVALRLRDRAVSRTHARIRAGEGGFLLEDLGTPNGVFLNGQRVQGPLMLADGDVIELGRSLLRFQAPVEEPPPPPPPPEPPPAESPSAEAPAEAVETPVPGATSETVAEPSSQPSPEPLKRRPRGEWWLIGLGAVAALTGLLVTYALASG